MTTVVVNGIFTGLVYGLLAVGLVVVYRGTRVINFAYGETGMIGAFVFSELWVGSGVALVLALLAGVLASATVGALTEVALVRPLRGQPPLTAMVGTLAVASLILTFASRRYGVNPRFLPPLAEGGGVRVLGQNVRPGQLVILCAVLGVLAGLAALYRWTSFGLRLRATAVDPLAAGLVGVDTDRTSLATWALAGGLAGLSAIVIAPSVAFGVFFSPIVGFLLGSAVLSEPWPLWQVIPLALVLAAPFAAGAVYGFRAIRGHDRTGWVGLIVHVAMMAVAIVMPISESVAS